MAAQSLRHSMLNISRNTNKIIAIGASTGGTDAIQVVVENLPKSTPGIVVVQHMPAGFTKMYADRLNNVCQMEVKEAEDGDVVRQGLIIIGAGEHHLRLKKSAMGYTVESRRGDKVSGHCPSVDVLFDSVADIAKANALGVILTGMGADGAKGMLKMKNSGAFTIGQDEKSCVVYGMPMVAQNMGAVTRQAPLQSIAGILIEKLR
jgi:two-component system chemotaxis response regulator CheB